MHYDEIIRLVERLSYVEQIHLVAHLLERARERQLSADERKTLLRASILDVPVAQEPSLRRADG
jgi:hypothetical protein